MTRTIAALTLLACLACSPKAARPPPSVELTTREHPTPQATPKLRHGSAWRLRLPANARLLGRLDVADWLGPTERDANAQLPARCGVHAAELSGLVEVAVAPNKAIGELRTPLPTAQVLCALGFDRDDGRSTPGLERQELADGGVRFRTFELDENAPNSELMSRLRDLLKDNQSALVAALGSGPNPILVRTWGTLADLQVELTFPGRPEAKATHDWLATQTAAAANWLEELALVEVSLAGQTVGLRLRGGGETLDAFYAQVLAQTLVQDIGMMPALEAGDAVLLERTAEQVRRGDIVMHRDTDQEGPRFFHRVVAVAGDTIEMTAGQLRLNGTPVPTRPLARGRGADPALFVETLGASSYRIRRPADSDGDFVRVLVPAGHVFVLNDTRTEQNDSRMSGALPLHEVHGRASFVYLSSDGFGVDGIRWSRLGEPVH